MDQLIQTLRKFGAVRLVIIASIIIGLGSGLHYLASRVAQPEMALLYSNLDLSDSGKIVSKLETMGINAQIRGGGSEIHVPASNVARLRMEMAEIGLPRGGSIGYEIFDKSDSLGTSSFVQDINHLRALEGEIARSISSLSLVESTRVHLVLPRRELFSRTQQEPSASIILTLKGPGRLPPQKIQAIQYMVASAVPSLTPEKVSIVDDRGNLLARSDINSDILSATNLEEMRLSYQNRLSQIIESLVEKHVGPGKVRAEVSVDMNFDRVTENLEEFDPDGQVVRSTQTIAENESSKDPQNQGNVAAEQEIPQGQAGAAGPMATSTSQRTEETVNYEITKKIRSHTREIGAVNRLSVAVLVDGIYAPGEEGAAPAYTPLPTEEMEKLDKLVKNAIGFSEERGDTVEVINMKFAKLPEDGTLKDSPSFLSLSQPDIVRLVEALIIGIMALLMLLLVVKPLVIRLLEGTPKYEPVTTPTETAETDLISKTPEEKPKKQTNESLERMVDLQQVEGKVRESSLKKISEAIDAKPSQAANIVRDWMQEKV